MDNPTVVDLTTNNKWGLLHLLTTWILRASAVLSEWEIITTFLCYRKICGMVYYYVFHLQLSRCLWFRPCCLLHTIILIILSSSGTKFLCSVLVAPVKNENNEIILFILNLEDITDAPVRSDHCRNSLKNSKYSKY